MPNRPDGDRKAHARRTRRRILARGVAAAGLAALLATLAPGAALAQKVGIIRDAEIEELLQDYARPLFRAAGVKSSSMEIFIVPNRSFNAFVAGGQKMFINTGALLGTDTPNELIGIMAHETGHVAGAHLAGLRQIVDNTKVATLIAGLIGFGAAIAGAAITGNSDFANAGAGLMAGISVAGQRNILTYARGEENAADTLALRYLQATGQSAAGMLKTFERLANDTLLASRDANPYLLSHPLPRERIGRMEQAARGSPHFGKKDPPDLQLRHDLMRAKLAAFTEAAQVAGRRYPESDTRLPARYARAIIAYRFGSVDRAVQLIDGLIAVDAGNPYFHELKGQALLEHGRAREALDPLRRSVQLRPSSGLLRILLGHALVETGGRDNAAEAIKHLTVGLQADPSEANGYRQLARAYGATGDVGMAQLATAQGLMSDGKVKEAKEQAAWAQAKLKRGSPAWLRADDILAYKPPKDR